jgi:hypothetical protein
MAQPNLSHPLAHNVELPMDSRTPTELVRAISDITSVLNVINGVTVSTIAADHNIEPEHGCFLLLDPNGGHKDARLWEDASLTQEAWVFISNMADAAENLVVKNRRETTTYATVGQDEVCIMCMKNGVWSLFGKFAKA